MPQLDELFPRLWVPHLRIQAKDLTPDARGHYDLGFGSRPPEAGRDSYKSSGGNDLNRGGGLRAGLPGDEQRPGNHGTDPPGLQHTISKLPQWRDCAHDRGKFRLLIACANIAGMLLARGAARVHEMAVRAAVGAARLSSDRQMLAESLLIGAAGGGAALLGSVFGIKLLQAAFAFNDFGKRVGEGLRLDLPTLFFTLTASLLTTLMFGLMPAIRASKVNPRDALTDRSPTSSAGFGRIRLRSGSSPGRLRWRLYFSRAQAS